MVKQGSKRPLVVLTGPTAVGKTALSLALANRMSGEIISADSMQVYRGLDIGSAKIRPEEMQGIRHHLIDVVRPDEPFDVHRFQTLAKEAAEEIRTTGHLPIVVGGTGFYIQALLYDIDFTPEEGDEAFRRALEQRAEEEGAESLHRMLSEVDPESARAIHPHNIKRVIRA
ncbi:MAG: tRNA (adenosine(37)-N6)-dimethylallyltransferase MiaA, partial [Lachnospiraceae bacterium]|nr:tRNA (adenosine(37)-N6)-dimethylallyltransferase MiaA [Lachnospiraceae bacterium]